MAIQCTFPRVDGLGKAIPIPAAKKKAKVPVVVFGKNEVFGVLTPKVPGKTLAKKGHRPNSGNKLAWIICFKNVPVGDYTLQLFEDDSDSGPTVMPVTIRKINAIAARKSEGDKHEPVKPRSPANPPDIEFPEENASGPVDGFTAFGSRLDVADHATMTHGSDAAEREIFMFDDGDSFWVAQFDTLAHTGPYTLVVSDNAGGDSLDRHVTIT